MQFSCDSTYICRVERTKYTSKLDHAGMTASVLCAVHCAIVPLLITVLPLAGLGFLANPLVEWSMIIFALFVGCYAIGSSYFRIHHQALPVLVLIAGFMVIITGHIWVHGWREGIIVPMGGLLIATAHFINYRYAGNCTKHTHHQSDGG